MSRPVPADFAEMREKLGSSKNLQRHYRVGSLTIARWRKETGLPSLRQIKPLPIDLAEMREKLGSIRKLAAHYGVSDHTVKKWMAKASLPDRPKCVIPDDLIDVRKRLGGARNVAAHYGVSRTTVDRWVAELGLPDLRFTTEYRERARVTATKRHAKAKKFHRRMPPNGSPTLHRLNNYSIHDEAADILRPHFPVYRCGKTGLHDPKGKFWRVGNVVCDGDELLVRAAKYRRAA